MNRFVRNILTAALVTGMFTAPAFASSDVSTTSQDNCSNVFNTAITRAMLSVKSQTASLQIKQNVQFNIKQREQAEQHMEEQRKAEEASQAQQAEEQKQAADAQAAEQQQQEAQAAAQKAAEEQAAQKEAEEQAAQEQAEQQKAEAQKKQEEAAAQAEAQKQAEAKQAADAQAAEQQKQEEAQKAAEAQKQAEQQKAAEAQKQAEAQKAAEQQAAQQKAAQQAATQKQAQQAAAQRQTQQRSASTAAAQTTQSASSAAASSGNGQAIVNIARKYLGRPYVYGGRSLTNGCDCASFVALVYREYGRDIGMGGCANIIRTCGGTNVGGNLANMKPGDIVFFGSGSSLSHMAIYTGNNRVIHALNPSKGIVETPLYVGGGRTYSGKSVVAVRRIV